MTHRGAGAWAALLAGVVSAACRGETVAPALLDATIARRTDTLRFQTRVVVYQCDSTADLLVEGAGAGNGVLVWLRPRDSLGGAGGARGARGESQLPIVGLRDTITRPAAVVAVRYNSQQVLHPLSLDSGSVSVLDSGGGRRVAVTGSGVELQFGMRSSVAASFTGLRLVPDSTTTCAPAPAPAPAPPASGATKAPAR